MISEPLDAAGVEAVAAIPDPVLRNLWITQSYFGLNTRMQHAVGGADRTWCGFAVWASDTAGQSIRGEELPHLVVQLTDQLPEHLDDVAQRQPPAAAAAGRARLRTGLGRPAAAGRARRARRRQPSTSPTATPSSTASSVRCSWRSSSGARPAIRPTIDQRRGAAAARGGGRRGRSTPISCTAFEWWRTALVRRRRPDPGLRRARRQRARRRPRAAPAAAGHRGGDERRPAHGGRDHPPGDAALDAPIPRAPRGPASSASRCRGWPPACGSRRRPSC